MESIHISKKVIYNRALQPQYSKPELFESQFERNCGVFTLIQIQYLLQIKMRRETLHNMSKTSNMLNTLNIHKQNTLKWLTRLISRFQLFPLIILIRNFQTNFENMCGYKWKILQQLDLNISNTHFIIWSNRLWTKLEDSKTPQHDNVLFGKCLLAWKCQLDR